MIKNIDYNVLENELKNISNSNKYEDKLECAYHYGHFGFNAYTLKYLKDANYLDEEAFDKHLGQLDSTYHPNCKKQSELIFNNYSSIERGNCDFLSVDEFEIVFDDYHLNQREIGIYIHILPFIESVKKRSKFKSIKINCNERMRELFNMYFPYIEIGTSTNKVSYYQLIENVYQNGGSSLIREAVKGISKRVIRNKNPSFIGVNWFANNIYDRYRSIPIGLLINTVGSHDKDLNVMSLQYNNPEYEIDIFNRYSKNKITEVYDNDIQSTPLEILEAVSRCYCFVGIQSEAAMMAYCLCGIPTIVTASSPNMYWYFLDGLNPFLHSVRMRFSGDYDYIIKNIRKLL